VLRNVYIITKQHVAMKPGIDYVGVGCGCVIINDKNEVLLVKRSNASKTEPGMWSRPGGTVEFGETVEEALKREIKEELDIEIEVLSFLEHTNNMMVEDGTKKHWLAMGFLAKIKSGEPKNMEPRKHDDVKWFPLNNLPEDLTVYTKNAIDILNKSTLSN
jgi:ADP-ribose pyrophosphatase